MWTSRGSSSGSNGKGIRPLSILIESVGGDDRVVEPVRYGPYIVVRKLGEGGMGAVFEVRHETIEKRAAIKILRPEYAQTPDAAIRFINEARSVNRVEHPGLIQIYDFVQQEDGTSYIVMEYLGGETVSSRLKKCDAGYYSIRDVIAIGWQIAES